MFSAAVRTARRAARVLTAPFRAGKTSPIRRKPLGFEPLEGREVPATYWWVGDFSEHFVHTGPAGKNWVVSPTEPTNVTPATPRPFNPPGANDDLMFDGDVAQGDCVWGAGSGSVKSIGLVDDFENAVEMGGGVTTGALWMEAGDIWQAVNTTLTVTSRLDWIGGRLNTNGYAARLVLTGAMATGTIDPADGQTLESGDTISVENGATATLDAGGRGGTLLMRLATSLMAASGAALVARTDTESVPAAADLAVKAQTTGGKVVVDGANSSLTVRLKSGITPDPADQKGWKTELPVQNSGGKVRVQVGVNANVTGSLTDQGVTANVLQTGGAARLFLEWGSTLTVSDKVLLRGGKLATMTAYGAASNEARIAGKLVNSGADVTIGDPEAGGSVGPGRTHEYGVLHVTGDIDWSGGVYRPAVGSHHGAGGPKCDVWRSGSTFRITAGPGGAGVGPIISDNMTSAQIKLMGNYTVITAASVQYQNSTVLGVEPAANPPNYNWEVALNDPTNTEVRIKLV